MRRHSRERKRASWKESGEAARWSLVLAQRPHRIGGSAWSVPVLADRDTPESEGVRAVDLLCSPNAHTRPIVLLDSRCSSKRAVGDQSALPRRENKLAWKEHLGAHAWTDPGCFKRQMNEQAWKEHLSSVLAWVKRTSLGKRLQSNRWVGG